MAANGGPRVILLITPEGAKRKLTDVLKLSREVNEIIMRFYSRDLMVLGGIYSPAIDLAVEIAEVLGASVNLDRLLGHNLTDPLLLPQAWVFLFRYPIEFLVVIVEHHRIIQLMEGLEESDNMPTIDQVVLVDRLNGRVEII